MGLRVCRPRICTRSAGAWSVSVLARVVSFSSPWGVRAVAEEDCAGVVVEATESCLLRGGRMGPL